MVRWWLVVAAILVAALAVPAVQAQPRDIVLVLDNSGSMKQNDPQRLAVRAVTDFIRSQGPETRLALIVFADRPDMVLPLTAVTPTSQDFFLEGLNRLNYRGQWTDMPAAVERGLYELRLNGRADAFKALVLMTDGIVDTGDSRRDADKTRWLQEGLAADARRNGVRIFGLAFTEGADYQLLQSLALATEGDYFRALEPTDLAAAFARMDALLVSAPTLPEETPTSPASAPERVEFIPPSASVEMPAAEKSASEEEAASSEEPTSSWFVWSLLAVAVLAVAFAAFVWRDRLRNLLPAPAAQAEADHGPHAVLYDISDPGDIKRHELGNRPVVIGRAPGSDPSMEYIIIDERTVGRWHATIERRGQSYWIRDEGSVNGTFVNDQRVTSEHPLKHGDIVRVHRHEFEFVIPELFDSDRTMVAADGLRAKPAEDGADA